MRITSELFVKALCRTARGQGAFAYVTHKGAESAGAVFIATDNMQGSMSLYGPAIQMMLEDDGERRFECVIENGTRADIEIKMASEIKFDQDLWLVEIEDRDARPFVELISVT